MQFGRRAVYSDLCIVRWRLPALCHAVGIWSFVSVYLRAFFLSFRHTRDSRALLYLSLDMTRRYGGGEAEPSSRPVCQDLLCYVASSASSGGSSEFDRGEASANLSLCHTHTHTRARARANNNRTHSLVHIFGLSFPPLKFLIHYDPPMHSDSSPKIRGGVGELYSQSIMSYVYSLQGHPKGAVDGLRRCTEIFVKNPGICRFTAW